MSAQVKIIAALVTAILLSIFVTIGAQQVMSWKHGAEAGAQRKQTAGAASAITTAQPVYQDQQHSLDQGIAQGRNTFHDDMEKARNEDPDLRTRATAPVNDRVRDAFRKRRLARERLGCAGDECQE